MRGAAAVALCLLALAGPARAADERLDAAVGAAAAAAGLPEQLVSAVVQAESGGDPDAVSRAGAMGLMQLMPRTWRDLRARLGLGADPFDPADNLMAGAVYLREMLDRFGPDGFLAAYNAGPGRYAEHLAGRPLPRETRAYVARMAALVAGADGGGVSARLQAARWTRSGLFPEAGGKGAETAVVRPGLDR